ncbi:phosphotransferase family protein [Histoplasma ohiense]|nr:phosphotransferase family protein [Histoplasma ohiense (nom. inval.)]
MPPLENSTLRSSSSDAETSVEKIKYIFPESSFSKERRALSLPTPAEIRAINAKPLRGGHPPPVKTPSLGLFVRYGNHVTTIEAQTQITVRNALHSQAPVPEVFGWVKDGR